MLSLLILAASVAFVCNICGRRFGVASNLNRHTKRCAVRPVNATRGALANTVASSPAQRSLTQQAPEQQQQQQHAESSAMAISATNPDANKSVHSGAPVFPVRGRRQPARRPPASQPIPPVATTADLGTGTGAGSGGSNSGYTGSGSGSDGEQKAALDHDHGGGRRDSPQQPRTKRRRRAPSPSRWVPDSLRNFDLTPTRKSVPTPLPPVSPYHDPVTGEQEERDSFTTAGTPADENTAPPGARVYEAPYHPCGWSGRLPGPAVVVGGDLTNIAGSSTGHSGGRGGYTFTFVTGLS